MQAQRAFASRSSAFVASPVAPCRRVALVAVRGPRWAGGLWVCTAFVCCVSTSHNIPCNSPVQASLLSLVGTQALLPLVQCCGVSHCSCTPYPPGDCKTHVLHADTCLVLLQLLLQLLPTATLLAVGSDTPTFIHVLHAAHQGHSGGGGGQAQDPQGACTCSGQHTLSAVLCSLQAS